MRQPVVIHPGTHVSFGASLGLADRVATWLDQRTEIRPARPIRWRFRGHADGFVRNVEHLSVRVSRLPQPGDWAVIEWADPANRRWCQTMRYPHGWIVEAHDGTDNDYAKRVFRGEPGEYPRDAAPDDGHTCELWQPLAAADLIWSWLHGNLPEGCARTMRHVER